MRTRSMNRNIVIGLTLVSGILAGCQDFLSQDRSEATNLPVTESAQQTGVQEDAGLKANTEIAAEANTEVNMEANVSVDCAELEAQMQATIGDPLAYSMAKEAWYQTCRVAPPSTPQPVDTATLCRGLAETMAGEKSQTLEGYYQPLKVRFDEMNCSQYVGPAPGLNLVSAQPAPTPAETKAAPTEPIQPLNTNDMCLGIQEAMGSEKARTDDAYYFQLKTQFGESGCTWVSAPVQPTAADTAKACLNFQQTLTQLEPGSTKAALYNAFIAENCSN